MWLAFVMAILPGAGGDGRGIVGPFRTEADCKMFLERSRMSPQDYCAQRQTEYQRLNFGKLD